MTTTDHECHRHIARRTLDRMLKSVFDGSWNGVGCIITLLVVVVSVCLFVCLFVLSLLILQ